MPSISGPGGTLDLIDSPIFGNRGEWEGPPVANSMTLDGEPVVVVYDASTRDKGVAEITFKVLHSTRLSTLHAILRVGELLTLETGERTLDVVVIGKKFSPYNGPYPDTVEGDALLTTTQVDLTVVIV